MVSPHRRPTVDRVQPREARILHSRHFPHCTAQVDKHYVGYCSLQFITAGAVELAYGPRTHHLEAGWLWPCFPGPRIRFHAAGGHRSWDHRYIALAGPALERWRATGLWPSAPQQAPADYPCSDTFDRMLALAARNDPWGERRALHLLEDILLALAEVRGEDQDEPWVARARRALAQPVGLRSDITATARRFDMAPATFRRRFRAATGMSPREYALQARLERVRERLLEGGDSVATIAADLGYRDAFLLSRQFKARFGLSPSDYRATRLD